MIAAALEDWAFFDGIPLYDVPAIIWPKYITYDEVFHACHLARFQHGYNKVLSGMMNQADITRLLADFRWWPSGQGEPLKELIVCDIRLTDSGCKPGRIVIAAEGDCFTPGNDPWWPA